MIYSFECNDCGKTQEIMVPISEKYIPECCGSNMREIFTTTMHAGANVPND